MKKQFKCDSFSCSDPSICPEYCNGLCSGKMNEGFSMCGCEACNYHRLVGPYMTCTLADEVEYPVKKKHIIDYDLDNDNWSEYDEEMDNYIANP